MAENPGTRIKLNPSFWRHGSCVPFSDDVVPSSLFLKFRHYLVLDIETQKLAHEVGGWDHIDKLGVSDRLELALYAIHKGLHLTGEAPVR